MIDAERKLMEYLAQYSEAEQERILQYAIDHILPNLPARRLHPLKQSREETDFAKRWICLQCQSLRQGFHHTDCPEFTRSLNAID